MATAVSPSPMTAAEETAYKRRWIALLLLSLSLVLIVVDSTIVNIAFPAIRSTFGASFTEAEWVNSIYSLVFGTALITWGKLGDQYGRRNIFVAGAILFAFSSAGVGLASSIGMTIFFRALQGMGGAMMSPSTLSIVSATFKGRERGIAFGIWGATAGVSVALGPILGGWLIEYGTGILAESWRLAFLVNLPIAAVAIAGSFWAIRESHANAIKHQIDWIGIILASLALGSFVFGTIEGQAYGWLEAKKVFTFGSFSYPSLADGVTQIAAGTPSFIPFVFAFGAVMFVLFMWVEIRQERAGSEPLFEFGMLRYRSFRYGLITIFVVALGEFATFLVLSIYLQLAKGLGAFETGLQFLPFAIMAVITAPLAGVLSSRIGAKWIVTLGMLCEAISLFWISRVLYYDLETSSLILPLMVYGVGIGLAIAQLANIVLSDIPMDKAGVASGATNTMRQLGGSLGIAIIGAVLFGTFADAATPLIQQTTAFSDFVDRVSANTTISDAARTFGTQFANFEETAKQGIIEGLRNNEGFPDVDPIDSAIANIPLPGRIFLRTSGVDLDDPAVVEQIRTDLAPDAAILQADIQRALGEGFSTAGRAAATLSAIFVGLGAISSLMLPKAKRAVPGAEGETAAVMAH
jgi:MFS family permease